MNRKETIQVLALLDECIDHAGHPSVMLALDALRRNLLQAWQGNLCGTVDAALMMESLSVLPALCREGCHPALPLKLSQAVFCLYAPAVDPAQCSQQAVRIRCLRRWEEALTALLVHYDGETAREAQRLLEMQLAMMAEVFGQILTVARGRMIMRAAQHRAKRLEEIAGIRESLILKDVSDAQSDARTVRAMTREKFSDFAADIAASAELLQVKELQPGAMTHMHKSLEDETEE